MAGLVNAAKLSSILRKCRFGRGQQEDGRTSQRFFQHGTCVQEFRQWLWFTQMVQGEARDEQRVDVGLDRSVKFSNAVYKP